MSNASLVRRTNGTVAVAAANRTPLLIGTAIGVLAATLLPFWLIIVAAIAGGVFYFKR